MSPSVKPGWYRSNWSALPNAIRVHSVHDGMVYFSRRGLAHMSITPLASFVALVIL